MPEQNPTTDPLIPARLEEAALRLRDEIQKIGKHPLLVEILKGEFIHDGSLPIPSKNFILSITFHLLSDKTLRDQLQNDDNQNGLQRIIKWLLNLTSAEALKIARVETDRRETMKHLYANDTSGNGGVDWIELCILFRDGDDLDRIIAEKAMHLMMSIAVLKGDHHSLQGLASATKELFGLESDDKPSKVRTMITAIRSALPILKENLSWPPNKSAVKHFVLEASPEISDSESQWAKAWKTLPEFSLSDRHIRMTDEQKDEVTSLALQYRRPEF